MQDPALEASAAPPSLPSASLLLGRDLRKILEAAAAAKRQESILLAPDEMQTMLTQLGMVCAGPDPDQRDCTLWHQPSPRLFVSIPSQISGPDLARAIWHAGAREARREIREARQAYLRALSTDH